MKLLKTFYASMKNFMKRPAFADALDTNRNAVRTRLGFILGSFFLLTATLAAQTTGFGILTWRWDCGDPIVTVEFTTNVNATLAMDATNYSFDPPVNINSITHSAPSAVVVLDVSTLSTTGVNILTVTNITSLAGVALDPQYTQAFLYCHDHSPLITCPDDIIIDCAPAGGVTTNLTVEVFDEDGDPLTVVWNIDGLDVATNAIPAGTPFTLDTDSLTHTYPVGTNSVIVSVTDGVNTNACEFRVIVNPAGPPMIDCPQGPFEILGADCANPEVFDLSSLVTIHGDCYTTNDFTFTHSPPVGTPLPHGTNTVTLTITGPNNFEMDCDVLFIVDCPPDPCEVFCPDPGFQISITNCPALMPDVTQYVTLSGNCDPTQYTLTQSIPVGTSLSNGVHWVNVNITGPGGFDEDCRIKVIVDMAPPILHCRDEGVIVLPVNDDCEALLPPMPYTITPGCTPLNDLIVTQTPPAGTLLGPGIHWVTLEVHDPVTGQSVFCRFQVHVVDRLPPRIVCPEVEPVEDCEAEVPDLIPDLEIITHCDSVADLTIIQTPAPGTIVGPGNHTITITVTDPAGNTVQCATIFEVLGTGSAAPIANLRNTGVNVAGSLLPLFSVDPHYELTTSADPSAPGPDAYVVDPRPGAWVANTATSQWISPTNTLSTHTPGAYVYQIQFTLPATFSSASISGTWATDNSAEIYLNGVPSGITKTIWGFQSLTPFTITSGFVPGVNVLEFRIQAISFYTGLHVSDLKGTVWTCEEIEPCVPPAVLISPFPSQTVAWGGSAMFSASVSGTPPFSYQWYHNNMLLPGETGPTLTVSPTTFADSGWYTVVVSNPCGEVTRGSRLRVRRRWGTVIDLWDFARPIPLPDPLDPSPIIGDFGTPLDPLPLGPDALGPYENTAVAAQFGRSSDFDIPGPNGVPVDVMQFTYGLSDTGYALSYDPAALPQQTIAMDLYAPEAVCMLPLLRIESAEGGDSVVYLCVGTDIEPTPEHTVLQIPAATWVRILVVWDSVQNQFNGYVLGRQGVSLDFSLNGLVPSGSGIHRLLPSSDTDHGVLYVHSLAWYDAAFTRLDIATQGAASNMGLSGVDPIREQATLEFAPAPDADWLSIRWRTADFFVQQSTNLVDWEYIALTPTLVTDTADEVEYRIDLPIGEKSPRFYRAVTISPDIFAHDHDHDHDDE